MIRVLVALGLLAALGAAEIAVVLRPQATVAADHALLGDVADLAGDADAVAALRAVTVQALPDLGERTLGEREIRAAIGRLAAGRTLRIEGACRLSRAALTLAPERLREAAIARIRADRPGADVQVVREPASLVVPDGGEPVEIIAEPLVDATLGEVPLRLRALRAGRELARTLTVLRVRALEDQVVAARPLARGTVLGAGDVRVERREAQAGETAPADAALVVGWVVRRDLAEGATIDRRAALPPPAVRGGQPIEIAFVHGEFALTVGGVALNDGQIGDLLQVRRGTDGRVIPARVVADGRVQVNY